MLGSNGSSPKSWVTSWPSWMMQTFYCILWSSRSVLNQTQNPNGDAHPRCFAVMKKQPWDQSKHGKDATSEPLWVLSPWLSWASVNYLQRNIWLFGASPRLLHSSEQKVFLNFPHVITSLSRLWARQPQTRMRKDQCTGLSQWHGWRCLSFVLNLFYLFRPRHAADSAEDVVIPYVLVFASCPELM